MVMDEGSISPGASTPATADGSFGEALAGADAGISWVVENVLAGGGGVGLAGAGDAVLAAGEGG